MLPAEKMIEVQARYTILKKGRQGQQGSAGQHGTERLAPCNQGRVTPLQSGMQSIGTHRSEVEAVDGQLH